MVGTFRPRRFLTVALLGAFALGLTACGRVYPNSTFSHNTDFNRSIDSLWDTLLLLGTIVFVGVEAALIYVIFRFRRRPNAPQPKPVHGSTTLEITWTVIPAVILIFIAIPTVRTIFRTQAKAVPTSLQVEVIGHQWWWEFRYPQYGFSTANELYLPQGRTANFKLQTMDVLHSFWIPQMGGKRDLITNRTNYLWFTPDSVGESSAYNGACAEYCGTSHANMKFRVFVVTPSEFDGWVKNQQTDPAFTNTPALPPAAAASVIPAALTPAGTAPKTVAAKVPDSIPAVPAATARPDAWTFPADKIAAKFAFTVPQTPIPDGNNFDDALLAKADPAKGATNAAVCAACHQFSSKLQPGLPIIAPNLTHIGSRHTIGAGLYPNDDRHLARWIKNSPHMKPGSLMKVMGKGQLDPEGRKGLTDMAMYSDAQIADIVAYLRLLK
jgi:cytochrome c oxidase subunit 2